MLVHKGNETQEAQQHGKHIIKLRPPLAVEDPQDSKLIRERVSESEGGVNLRLTSSCATLP